MSEVHKIGRRKSSIARVFINDGSGKITVNGKDYKEYFPTKVLQYKLVQPLAIADSVKSYDIKINVKGGGVTGQVEAIRLAISRALSENSEEVKKELKSIGLLTRDSRMVERKKFGQKKARKKFQFSKR